MAQEQVLGHEIVAPVRPRQDGREQQPPYFEHAFRIADLPRARFCRRTPPPCARDEADRPSEDQRLVPGESLGVEHELPRACRRA